MLQTGGRTALRSGRILGLVLGLITFGVVPVVAQVVTSRPSATADSEFLRPPGDGRYDDPVDESHLPPWQQTSFFGIRARGSLFIYVVDCSGSMADEARLARAKAELRRSILDLRWPQRFLVIFYNDAPRVQPGGVPRPAQFDDKSALFRWFQIVEAGGGTDPRAALALALAMQPDAVFLLSDGLFPEGTVQRVAEANARKVPVHCVDLAGGAAGGDLRAIAEASGGQYVARP